MTNPIIEFIYEWPEYPWPDPPAIARLLRDHYMTGELASHLFNPFHHPNHMRVMRAFPWKIWPTNLA